MVELWYLYSCHYVIDVLNILLGATYQGNSYEALQRGMVISEQRLRTNLLLLAFRQSIRRTEAWCMRVLHQRRFSRYHRVPYIYLQDHQPVHTYSGQKSRL